MPLAKNSNEIVEKRFLLLRWYIFPNVYVMFDAKITFFYFFGAKNESNTVVL